MAYGDMTQMAIKAFTLADLVQAAFAQPIDGPVSYKVELATPDGPSTAGGKQALQHLRLVPVPEGSGMAIVIGTASNVDNVAELRSFKYLRAVHAQRFKKARLPLEEKVYSALLVRLQQFFADRKMSVAVVDAPRNSAEIPAAPAPSSPKLAILLAAVGAFILIGAAAAAFLFLRQ